MAVTCQLPVAAARVQVKAGGAFAVFVMVFLLFFWGLPAAESKPAAQTSTTEAAAIPATLTNPPPRKMQSFVEIVSLGENDTAAVHNVAIRPRSIGADTANFV